MIINKRMKERRKNIMSVIVKTNNELVMADSIRKLLDLSLLKTDKAELQIILNTTGKLLTDNNTILDVTNARISFHDYNMAIKKLMQIEEHLNSFILTYSFCNILTNNFDFHVKHIKINQQTTFSKRIYQLRNADDFQLLLKIINATYSFQLDRKTINLINSLNLDFNQCKSLVEQAYFNLLTKSQKQLETSNNEQKQLFVLKTLLAQ